MYNAMYVFNTTYVQHLCATLYTDFVTSSKNTSCLTSNYNRKFCLVYCSCLLPGQLEIDSITQPTREKIWDTIWASLPQFQLCGRSMDTIFQVWDTPAHAQKLVLVGPFCLSGWPEWPLRLGWGASPNAELPRGLPVKHLAHTRCWLSVNPTWFKSFNGREPGSQHGNFLIFLDHRKSYIVFYPQRNAAPFHTARIHPANHINTST